MGTRHSSPKIELAEPFADATRERKTPIGLVRPRERNTIPLPFGYDGARFSEQTPLPSDPDVEPAPESRVQATLPPGWLVPMTSPDELRRMPMDSRMAYVVGLVGDGARMAEVVDASALGPDVTTDILEELLRLGVLRGGGE